MSDWWVLDIIQPLKVEYRVTCQDCEAESRLLYVADEARTQAQAHANEHGHRTVVEVRER